MTDHVIAWADVPASEAPGGIIKRKLDLPGVSLVTVHIPAGTQGERHDHPHEQFVQVESGTGTLETEQGVRNFGPGCVFVFPAGTWHIAKFETETVLIETNLAAA